MCSKFYDCSAILGVARRALIAASQARTQTAFVTASNLAVISHSGGHEARWVSVFALSRLEVCAEKIQ